ncbi:MAG: GNAT family acetyltransferase [Desulfocapsaceae bacterium]
MNIRPFEHGDCKTVIELWRRCGLVVSWNDPVGDIDRKMKVDPELFVVGLVNDKVIATVMGGYDGHRGTMFYLAVDERHQGQGYGRKIVEYVSELLGKRGCPKVNIMIRSSNSRVIDFYHRLGFNADEVVCLGKRLIKDEQ